MNQDHTHTPLLEISKFGLVHRSSSGTLPVLGNISFTLERGEILGIIGESGAGKSTLGNAVLGLLAPEFHQTSGSILLDGIRIDDMTLPPFVRGRRISAIFQDHTASLDPLMRVGAQVEEAVLALSPFLTKHQARCQALGLMIRVGIPDATRRYGHYPHQFSGGQRQRLVIAIALAGSPDIIVADEPTSALDATVQKQILALLRSLVDDTNVSILLVTHDMGVVSEITDRVIVMRGGEIVEQGSTADLLETPQNPYTRSLIAAVPRLRILPVGKEREFTADRDPRRPSDVYLAVNNISKDFRPRRLWSLRSRGGSDREAGGFALRGVNIRVQQGSITGIVGESGTGKTTIGRIIAGLETAPGGIVEIDGRSFDVAKSGRHNGILGHVQMIFQDPSMSLNPRLTIAETLRESVRFAAVGDKRPLQLESTIDRLKLSPNLLTRLPHQLSGGQKQRVCIARAILAMPQIIVADEPTSALDVSVQAEIIALLKDTVVESGMTMVFISHDLAVVQELCDHVYIFKDGQIEDSGSTDYVFSQSCNPYTQALIDARPKRFRA